MEHIKIDKIYGYCEFRSWFEFDGEKMFGMGGIKTYNRDGKLTDYTESPTGIVLTPESLNP